MRVKFLHSFVSRTKINPHDPIISHGHITVLYTILKVASQNSTVPILTHRDANSMKDIIIFIKETYSQHGDIHRLADSVHG